MTADPADRQHHLDEPLADDDAAVTLTALQAQKVAAVLSAALEGHALYAGAARAALDLLQACALEAKGITVTPSSAQAWTLLDDVPWPVPGAPRPQPDVE